MSGLVNICHIEHMRLFLQYEMACTLASSRKLSIDLLLYLVMLYPVVKIIIAPSVSLILDRSTELHKFYNFNIQIKNYQMVDSH